MAVHVVVTNLKSVSRLKLHRDIGVSQNTAWFMLHRLREAYRTDPLGRRARRNAGRAVPTVAVTGPKT